MINKIKQKLLDAWSWVKRKVKWILVTAGIVGIATAASLTIPEKPYQYQAVIWERPTTVEGWIEDVKKESLHFKFDYQLDQMEENLTEKLPRTKKELYWIAKYPDYKRKEIEEQFTFIFNDEEIDLNEKFEDKTLQEWIENEYQSELAYWQWKTDKINQSLERIGKEKELREDKKV